MVLELTKKDKTLLEEIAFLKQTAKEVRFDDFDSMDKVISFIEGILIDCEPNQCPRCDDTRKVVAYLKSLPIKEVQPSDGMGDDDMRDSAYKFVVEIADIWSKRDADWHKRNETLNVIMKAISQLPKVTDEDIDKKIFEICTKMRTWDNKSHPVTVPELIKEFATWLKSKLY